MARAITHQIRGRMSREAIVTAAEDVFGEYGYANATLAMISARVGMTQAGLLHHFGSKEALLQTVIDGHRAQDEKLCETLVAGGPDPLDAYIADFRESITDRRWTRLSAVLLGESVLVDHPANGYVQDRDQRLRAALTKAFETSTGASRSRVSAAVTILLATTQGLRMQILLDEDVDALSALVAVVEGTVRPLLS